MGIMTFTREQRKLRLLPCSLCKNPTNTKGSFITCKKCRTKNCLECGIKVVSPKGRNNQDIKKFCSKECRWKAHGKNISERQKGKNNPYWKGGRIKQGEGYIKILKPEHPYSDKKGYIFEHRLIMEKHLGRYLKYPGEEVHHRNAVKDDNRIENLELVLSTSHRGKINCPYCKKDFFIK